MPASSVRKPSVKKKKKLWARVSTSGSGLAKKKKKSVCKKTSAAAAAACIRRRTKTTTTMTTTVRTTTSISAAAASAAKKKRSTTTVLAAAAAAKNNNNKDKKSPKIYVLELQGGYVYVGKTSRSISTRLAEHMGGGYKKFGGAAFTRLHPPTGKLLKRLGNLEGDGDGPERDETLRQMRRHGPQKVRGWKYTRKGPLGKEDLQEIEANMREVFDLCRRCGKKGHFTMQCTSKKNQK